MQRLQLRLGLERLMLLVRAQAWRDGDLATLHPAQQALLAALATEGASLRIGELAERLGVSVASISDSIRTVEAKGLIERAVDPDDARARRLSLTPAGVDAISAIRREDNGLAQLLNVLTDADAASLLRIVQLLIEQAHAQGLVRGTRTCLGCAYFLPYANADTDPERPHVCAYVSAPFAEAELRVDCAEQLAQDDAIALAENVLRFRDRRRG